MLCNFVDLRPEGPVVLFQAPKEKLFGSFSKGLIDRGCICCDIMMVCGISVLREKSHLGLHFANIHIPVC